MTFLSIVPTTAEASTPVKKEKEMMLSPEDETHNHSNKDGINKSKSTTNIINNNNNNTTTSRSVAELQATVQQQETALKKANDRLRLLDSIATVQRLYLQWEEPRVVFGTLLEKLLELMDSEYGFIGEIKVETQGEEEVKYLQTHAITNIAWNAATHQFYNDNIESGLKFYNLQSLFGQVVLSQETMIANDPSTNKYACGVPEGHPPLNHFLGIPFFEAKGSRSSSNNNNNNSSHSNADGKRIMNGMVGIANKPGGYSQEDVEFLEPFLTTCSNLIQSYAAIRQNKELVETLEEKVEERTRALKQANSSLEQANQRVLAASQAQLQHFACMSHEIRTPLNCIIGLSSLLQETELNPYQGDCLKMIVTSGDLLLTVVNDVLDYSKLESGNVDISIRPINLQTCLDAVVHSIHQKAKPRGLQMDTRYSPQVPEVVDTDNRRLQQILYNLLGNAVKFSKPGGTVELHVELLENTKDMEKTAGKTNADDHSSSRNVQKPFVRRKSDPGLHLAKEGDGTSTTTTAAASAKCPYHTGTASDATTMLMDPDAVCPPMLKRLDTQSEKNIMEFEEGEPLAQAATTTATLHSTSKSTSTATPLFSLEPTTTPSQSFTAAPPPKCPFHAALHPKNSNDNDTNVDAGKSEEKSIEAHPNASDIDENQTKTTNTRNDAPVNVNVDALVASNFKEETPARPKPMRRSHSSRARLMANDDEDEEGDSSDDSSPNIDSSDTNKASSNSSTNNNETKKCWHGAIITPDDCPYILRFRIKDYGTGIEKKDFHRIFKPFKQANSQTETLYGGTGLGLAITTKLVKGLGGRISVDSVLDEWTEFTVDFPFSKAPFDVQQDAATLRQSPDTTLWSVHNTPEVSRFCQTVLEDHGVPCQKFDNMQSMLESIKAAPNRDGIQFLLVDEALYDGKAYAEFQQATGTNNNDTSCKTALITHGPNYSISEASLHFRSLRQVLPSVLMGSLTTMLRKATAVESNGEKADAKMEVNKPLSYDKLRILIAEDNVINQKVLSRMLHRSGIRDIDIADNGQIAVDKTAEKEYDIIFMDIGMPVLGGLDATKIITERDPSAKVVMCTAHALEEFRKLAESVGAASYVSKPFRPKDLEECFNELGFKK